MVIIPIVFVAGLILFVTCILFFGRFGRWLRGKPQPTLRWIRSRTAVVLGTTLLIGFGVLISVSPSVTRFATNGKVIVESGCHATSTYAKTIPLDFARITYEHVVGRRGRSTDSLVINGSGYRITLNLRKQKHWPALFRIAPDQVKQFAKMRREQGEDIPGPLLQLLKWGGT